MKNKTDPYQRKNICGIYAVKNGAISVLDLNGVLVKCTDFKSTTLAGIRQILIRRVLSAQGKVFILGSNEDKFTGMCIGLGIPYVVIKEKKWQAYTKHENIITKANLLLPKEKFIHPTAMSFLIAHYGFIK